jgi:hypothetical protein
MQRRICLLAIAAATAGLAVTGQAVAVGALANLAIIDRKTGAELTPHFYRGEYWVAGAPGGTYAIEIRNRTGERLLAVTSVDGVNVISGATAGWDQTGYVFDPGQGYEITGWRKSDSQVAAFTFVDSLNSYAQRTGRPANVGVIGVALFRERPPSQLYDAPPTVAPNDAPEPSPVPDEAPRPPPSARNEAATEGASKPRALEQPARKLGTGHGERETSYVTNTAFLRMQSEPNEVIRIRYDSFENLVAMGVIRRPHRVAATANPFPASAQQEYVPDPP